MLINPCKARLSTIPGTRILEDTLGIVGFQYIHPSNPQRAWALQHLLAPVPGRALGGIRAKFIDAKGFVTFCNQRDLEVLLGIAAPGDFCYWTGNPYPDPGDTDWYGFCADEQDLLDDLHERELRLREQFPDFLPSELEIVRRVHNDGSDSEELFVLLWDMDRHTGYGPDPRLETIESRWVRVERTLVKWAYTEA